MSSHFAQVLQMSMPLSYDRPEERKQIPERFVEPLFSKGPGLVPLSRIERCMHGSNVEIYRLTSCSQPPYNSLLVSVPTREKIQNVVGPCTVPTCINASPSPPSRKKAITKMLPVFCKNQDFTCRWPYRQPSTIKHKKIDISISSFHIASRRNNSCSGAAVAAQQT